MKRRMAALGWLVVYVLAFVLLLGALTTAFLRSGALPIAPARPLLERALSAAVGRAVSIGQIELRWHGLSPGLFARDVHIASTRPQDPGLSLSEVRLRLHLWRSLVSGRPRVRALAVQGATIDIERRADGRIVVHGLSGAHPRDVLGLVKRLLGDADLRLTLEQTVLVWTDRVQHATYRFNGVQLAAQRRGNRYRIGLQGALPDALGRTLRITTALSGALDEPATWRGRSYLRLTGALLAQGERWFALGLDANSQPLLDTELWVRWRGFRLEEVAGRIALQDLTLDPAHLLPQVAPGPLHVDRLDATGVWRRTPQGWVARLDRLTAAVEGQTLAETDLTLLARATTRGGRRYEIAAGQIEIAALAGLLQRIAPLRPYLDETRVLDAGGRLEDVYGVWVTGAHAEFALSARFRDAHLFGLAGVPGAYGLDGEFSLDRHGGDVALYSDDLFVTHAMLGDTPWRLGHIRALASWSHVDGTWQIDLPVLAVNNADLRLEALGWLRSAEGESPYLLLDLAVHEANLGALEKYLPVRGLNPRLREWLSRSVLGGRAVAGSLSLHGPLDRFPFDHGGGEFRASVRIEGGILRPSPLALTITGIEGTLDWYRAAMFGHADRFQSGALSGRAASVAIADLRRALLELNLATTGPVDGLRAVLADVYRLTHREDWTRRLHVDGQAHLDLSLRLPLAHAERKRTHPAARGKIQLSGVSLSVKGMENRLEDIEGAIAFDQGVLSGPALHARLNGVPLDAQITSTPAKGIHLGFQAKARVATLWPALPEWIDAWFDGPSRWKGDLRIPPGHRAGMRLAVESDLAGVSVRLPPPLGKPQGQARPLRIEVDFDGNTRRRIWLDYAGRAAVAAVLNHTTTGWQVERGELRFGAHRANLPAAGFRVRGTLPRLAPAEWLALLPEPSAHPLALAQGVDVDLELGRLALGRLQAPDMRFRARTTPGNWRLRLDAESLAGTIEIPRSANRFVPVVVDLDHLQWQPTEGVGQADPAPDPRDLPGFKLSIRRLGLGEGRQLTDLRAVLTPEDIGLRLQRLVFSGSGFKGSANGLWWWDPKRGARVKVQARVESEDVGATMKALRLDEGFRGGSGEIEIQMRWRGPPWAPRIATLQGQGVLRLEKGQIENLEPGMARVLGLINPAALPRRMALDFRDLLEKGYRYDLIEGAFTVEGTALHVRGLKVAGPAAELVINGRERLDARRHDLVVDVTPQLGLGPAIAGTLLGGPVVGAAVFVAERLLKRGGADISRVARVSYRVEGDWDAPRIEPVSEDAGQGRASAPEEVIGSELLGAD